MKSLPSVEETRRRRESARTRLRDIAAALAILLLFSNSLKVLAFRGLSEVAGWVVLPLLLYSWCWEKTNKITKLCKTSLIGEYDIRGSRNLTVSVWLTLELLSKGEHQNVYIYIYWLVSSRRLIQGFQLIHLLVPCYFPKTLFLVPDFKVLWLPVASAILVHQESSKTCEEFCLSTDYFRRSWGYKHEK